MTEPTKSTNHNATSPQADGDDTFQNDLVASFKKIDLDCSGTITNDELWSQISGNECFGIKMTKQEAGILFDSIDMDNNREIDFAEYSCFMEEAKRRSSGEKAKNSILKYTTQRESLSFSYDKPNEKDEADDEYPDQCLRSSLIKSCGARGMGGSESSFFVDSDIDDDDDEDEDEDKDSSIKPRNSYNPNVRRGIGFFDVEVRGYEVTASDNPCVSRGTALELGWAYDVQERVHLDTFEEKRSKERSQDFRKEKKIPWHERERILRDLGVSKKEIQEAAKRATIIRNKRKKSIALAKQDKEHEKAEERWRKAKSIVSIASGSKKDDDKNWVDATETDKYLTVMSFMGLGEYVQ
mmetsp:Transcript_36144/g.75972  ORF Transcript_36144/g.75972 Transcript_36144/m.75972 type:complete len:353 (+) Transcript_36144:238-1296(+)